MSYKRNDSNEVSKMVKVEGNCFIESGHDISNRSSLNQKMDAKEQTMEEHITAVREDLKGRIDKLDLQMREFEKDNMQDIQYPVNKPPLNNIFLSPEIPKKSKFLDQSNINLKETLNSTKYSILNNSTNSIKMRQKRCLLNQTDTNIFNNSQ